MVKVYKLHPASFYFLIVVILIVVIGTFVFPDKDKFQYYLGLFLIPTLTMGFILLFLAEIVVDDIGIWMHFRHIPLKGKRIKWEDIKYIDDDHFLFAHSFRIFPHISKDGNLIEKMRNVGDSIRIINFIKKYDELLREVLVRCQPGVNVEEIVLRHAEMTWEQVEIERRKRWLKKEE